MATLSGSTIEFIATLCNFDVGDKQKDFLDYCDWKMWSDEPKFNSSVVISEEDGKLWRQYFGLIEMYYSQALTEIHHNKKLNHLDTMASSIRQHIIDCNPTFKEPTECECCHLEPPYPEQCNYTETE
jgi:hypothetical protein